MEKYLTLSEITSVWTKNFSVDDTKSHKNRIIYLNEKSYEILQRRLSAADSKGYLFSKKRFKLFRQAVANSGLNEGVTDRRQKVVFHTLRHTFASWLIQTGTPITVVSQILGHSSLKLTMRYAHLSQDYSKNAVDVIDKQLQ